MVHAAIEEIWYLSGHNVISTIGAQLTEFRAELDTREARAANEALRRAGCGERIDHRSLAERRDEAERSGDLEQAAE